jgi:hypothetical protein
MTPDQCLFIGRSDFSYWCVCDLLDDPDPEDGFSYRQMISRDERRFKMSDLDADLKANKEEFTAFLHPEEYDHMKDIVVLVGYRQ